MSFFPELKFTGDQPKDIIDNIKKASIRYSRGGGWGIYAAMTDIVALGARNAPQLSGALEASGYVTVPRGGLGDPSVEGGFGGPADPYVIRVNRRTHFFTRALDGSGGVLEVARRAVVDFAENSRTPRRERPDTPHNATARAAAAAKGGP